MNPETNYIADTFYLYHHINAYEENGKSFFIPDTLNMDSSCILNTLFKIQNRICMREKTNSTSENKFNLLNGSFILSNAYKLASGQFSLPTNVTCNRCPIQTNLPTRLREFKVLNFRIDVLWAVMINLKVFSIIIIQHCFISMLHPKQCRQVRENEFILNMLYLTFY